ncbi:hypothetical protein D1007_31471 [Hordeum vulgare]|nr:hypothetical protein D1007_31471 [Hordeum vulgare]
MEPSPTNKGNGVARVAFVDWNSVELDDPTDLFTSPMADSEMANFIGIPVNDRNKEDMGESSFPVDANRDTYEDVDTQLME